MRTVEGGTVSTGELELLGSGESGVFAARPSYVTVGQGANWMAPLLLLTDERLVIIKERMFRRRVDHAVTWPEVSGVSGELWNGGGPQIRLVVSTQGPPIEIIVSPEHAVEVESAIRSGYISADSNTSGAQREQ